VGKPGDVALLGFRLERSQIFLGYTVLFKLG
jgi:hypothetical protein